MGERTDARNYGIDLLRIACMLMVPVLHVLGQGGVLAATRPLSARYAVAWLMETGAYCAVNCFAIVSGYVGYGSRHRFAGLLELCLQTVFYTVGVTLAFCIASPSSVGVGDFVRALVAPFVGTYWYLSSYLCLFFFMPWLDKLVAGADRAQAKKLIIALLLVFSLLPTVFHFDIASTKAGYSALWLGVMYVMGACMRRFGMRATWPNRRNLVAYGICVLVAWAAWLVITFVTVRVYGKPDLQDIVISYTAPLIVASSVALVLFFSRLRLGERYITFVRFFAPLCFGVYLLHVEPLLWTRVIKGAFAGYASAKAFLLPVLVLATAVGIWLVGSLVDWVRLQLFRLLRVRSLCDRLGSRLDAWLNPGFLLGAGDGGHATTCGTSRDRT